MLNNQTIPQQTEVEDKSGEENLRPELVAQVKVHTMPEKFLKHLPKIKVKKGGQGFMPGEKAKTSEMKKSILIGGVIGLIFVLVLGAAAWMFVRSIKQQSVEETDLLAPLPASQEETEEPELEQVKQTQEVCGQNNCLACDAEQCNLLSNFCHLEIIFEPCLDNPAEECAVQKCLAGAEQLDILEQQEEDSDEDFIPEEFKSSKDTDADGLTDIEESLWKTEINNKDTDGDSYLDGKEVYNLYNPVRSNSIKLEEDGLIKNFLSHNLGYSFYYPSKFELNVREGNESNLMIKSTSTQEFFNVLILDNETEMTDVNDWYLLQNPYAKINNIINRNVGSKKSVVIENGLNVYVLVNEKIYLISYYPGLRNELNFMTTFSMFLNSFEFFENPF